MGGKVWSVEEEKYFWEVIVPQAPVGMDEVSKKAKKEDAHMEWALLSRQMEREMTTRLRPNERLRRIYTPITCYEHYYHNYFSGHYSPHAKTFVLKYKADLEAAASATMLQGDADHDSRTQMSPQLVADPSRTRMSSQTAASLEFSHHMSHNNGAAVPMPMSEALVTPGQDQDGTSAMQMLCDAALAMEGDLPATKEGVKEDEGSAGGSRRNEQLLIMAPEDTNDIDDIFGQPGLGSNGLSQRDILKAQKDQRRKRKVAYRHAAASGVRTQSTILSPALTSPSGFANGPLGYYDGSNMYSQQPAYFVHPYGMQPMSPPLQDDNAIRFSHAMFSNGFHPYFKPVQFGGHPRFGVPSFNGPPQFGFGAHFPQHAFPYMGDYYKSGHTYNNGQGHGTASFNMDGGTGGYGNMDGDENIGGNEGGMGSSPGPAKKTSHKK